MIGPAARLASLVLAVLVFAPVAYATLSQAAKIFA
jgi:hypothetical protein